MRDAPTDGAYNRHPRRPGSCRCVVSPTAARRNAMSLVADIPGAPQLSVVVPAYNEELCLGRCLEAMSRQTCPAERFEVIVVDNGSTDATAEIARHYGARVLAEPRKGVARARQTGFEAARAKIIASTDADGMVCPTWVAGILSHFRADPDLGGVYGPVYWPDGRLLERMLLRYPATWVLWSSNRVGRTLWWGSNFAVRREVFHAAGGFPTDWRSCEDTDLSLRISRIARIRYDPAMVVRASPRRAREGWATIGRRTMADLANRFLLGRPPPAFPDIR